MQSQVSINEFVLTISEGKPFLSGGKCKNCENWQISRCINAEKTTGAFAEYSIMHYSSAVEIPDNMSFEVAAMTEPASCCFSGTEMIDYKK